MRNAIIVLILLVITIAAPYLLRPKDNAEISADADTERLVIISPHNESIMSEYSIAFKNYMQTKHDRKVYIDWRQPGGTSEISLFLKSEYTNAFGNLWKKETGLRLDNAIQSAFANRKQEPYPVRSKPYPVRSMSEEEKKGLARYLFLESDAGVGIDLFFGGGAYDFNRQASAGSLVATDASGKYGPGALMKERPEWFTDQVTPASLSGEEYRHPDNKWLGTVLSAFGLCYNKDVIKRLGVEPLDQWEDLANPKLVGQIALADPTKSGSATKAFEMLIQQKMLEHLSSMQNQARAIEEIEQDAIKNGWDDAMRMILKISANGRYFTDSASKVPHDVAQGESAAGMCIDFYGRTYNESKKKDGESRIVLVMPKGGTSIGADPIGMFRGAPNPELAHRFIEFVLSIDGQKIWNFNPGTPGGPKRASLRRPPIRKDFYTPENLQYMADADFNPYEFEAIDYRGGWTGRLFNSIRFIIRCTCVDTHIEQRRAWRALIDAGMPADALAKFEDVSAISYDKIDEINNIIGSKDKIKEVQLSRDLSDLFRKQYQEVIELSRAAVKL